MVVIRFSVFVDAVYVPVHRLALSTRTVLLASVAFMHDYVVPTQCLENPSFELRQTACMLLHISYSMSLLLTRLSL